jgi:hypothetical protein
VIDGRFTLRGAVDVIEERQDGSALRVTDHKTGKNRTTGKTVLGGGRILQPVLYSMAIEQALGRPVASGRLFYCTSAGGFAEREIPLNDVTRRAGLEALEIVDRAIELGFLPAAPDERVCAWCDFRPICGPDEERRVARKPAERLGDLIALRERNRDAYARRPRRSRRHRHGPGRYPGRRGSGGDGKDDGPRPADPAHPGDGACAEVKHVVAVTFTEKAAGELKLRLREALERERTEHTTPRCAAGSTRRSEASKKRMSTPSTASAPSCCASGRSRRGSIRSSRC